MLTASTFLLLAASANAAWVRPEARFAAPSGTACQCACFVLPAVARPCSCRTRADLVRLDTLPRAPQMSALPLRASSSRRTRRQRRRRRASASARLPGRASSDEPKLTGPHSWPLLSYFGPVSEERLCVYDQGSSALIPSASTAENCPRECLLSYEEPATSFSCAGRPQLLTTTTVRRLPPRPANTVSNGQCPSQDGFAGNLDGAPGTYEYYYWTTSGKFPSTACVPASITRVASPLADHPLALPPAPPHTGTAATSSSRRP